MEYKNYYSNTRYTRTDTEQYEDFTTPPTININRVDL